jgi:hypothetical protein
VPPAVLVHTPDAKAKVLVKGGPIRPPTASVANLTTWGGSEMGRFAGPNRSAMGDREVRLAGVALYAAIAAVAWWLLPATLPFVLPSAGFGMVMHAGRRRPWLGLAGFWVLLVLVPALFFPSLLSEAFSGLTDH